MADSEKENPIEPASAGQDSRPDGIDILQKALGIPIRARAEFLLTQISVTLGPSCRKVTSTDLQVQSSKQSLLDLAPRDEVERMLAVQMIATHEAAIDCTARAGYQSRCPEERELYLRQAAKFFALYLRQVESLDKHRGKGQPNTAVDQLNVVVGGQAIVGNVHASPKSLERASVEDGQAQSLLNEESDQSKRGEDLRKALATNDDEGEIVVRQRRR